MHTENRPPQPNDEIDLKELILTLWQGKWLIGIITLIFMLCGIVYVSFIQTQSSTFEVKRLPSYEMSAYNEINSLLEQLHEKVTRVDGDITKSQVPVLAISANLLLSNLMERVSTREDLLASAKKLEIIPKGKLTDEEWNDAIIAFVYDMEFLRPLSAEELEKNKTANPRRNWEINSQNIADSILYKQLIEESFAKSNEFVRMALLNTIEKEVQLLRLLKIHEIQDIDIEITNVKARYNEKIIQRKAELREQASIARQLNIAKNTLEGKEFTNAPNIISTTSEQGSPLYFRGYEALESELALLEERKEIEQHIPELVELNNRKRVLENDQLEIRLNQVIKNSPLSDKTLFHSAFLDSNEINFFTKPNKWVLLFVLGFLGGVIGVIVVLLKSLLSPKRIK